MPTYEYMCSACKHEWEAEQRIVESPLDECPVCHEKTAKRLISGANFILKGGGWYADLYSKPSKKNDVKSDGTSGNTDSSSAKTETKPAAESKPSTPTTPSA